MRHLHQEEERARQTWLTKAVYVIKDGPARASSIEKKLTIHKLYKQSRERDAIQRLDVRDVFAHEDMDDTGSRIRKDACCLPIKKSHSPTSQPFKPSARSLWNDRSLNA